ncbi:MAG: hypothetical protein AB7G28_02320 [Pirellulales bacterium]
MSQTVIFVDVHGIPGILETPIPPDSTLKHLYEALAILGVQVEADTLIFLDEAEDPLGRDLKQILAGLKHGSRVHVGPCRRVKTTVHYLSKTADHAFPPGTRLRRVKAWAARHFRLDDKDAAEHILQLCHSTERPSSDTPLSQLVGCHGCDVCFDLVPEKRVEG